MKNLEKEHSLTTAVKTTLGRRAFCVNCLGCVTGMMLLTNPGFLSQILASEEINSDIQPKLKKKEIRKLFMQKGSCAHVSLYLMNLEFGHNRSDEERAIDQLAGGLAQRGHQCGMLWGASMGASAEAYRRSKNKEQSMASAVFTSKHIIDAFTEIAGSPDCFDITNINLSKKFSKIKMVFSSAGDCFDLAYKWHPKAIETTEESLSQHNDTCSSMITCASEVVRKIGGSDEEMVMVSGFAGGLGLSGNACGALSAAIWMKTLEYCRKNPEERGNSFRGVEDILTSFDDTTEGEILCARITGRSFDSIDDHAGFVNSGGCQRIIESLAEVSTKI